MVLFNVSCTQQPADSLKSIADQQQKFDPSRDAQRDIQDAIRKGQKSHRRILLDVGGEWCIWCHRLDSLFLENKDLEEYLNNKYVVVKINVSKENKNEELLSKFPKVAGYPHIFVLDSDGSLLHSQDTGELEYPKNYPLKGHDKKKVFDFLRKWAQ
jgi:thioredoxin-related protein